MSKTYTVGRGSAADIQIPKIHDAVGKVHLTITDAGGGQATITDLKSTNGTFVRVGRKWDEIKGTRTVAKDAELMLGDYQTTPQKLLAGAAAAPAAGPEGNAAKKYRSSKEEAPEVPPTPPPAAAGKKRSGPRRNEFGEIVHE